MSTKQLIKENNQKRELLTKENKEYYEDMLVYIRLSYDKSEHETEEVLTEMLDHLIMAQNEGKTAEDVFGVNPKAYADEIVGELPRSVTKKQLSLMLMGIFYFLAVYVGFQGIFDSVSYYFFSSGSLYETVYLGSELVKLVVAVVIALVCLILILQLLKWVTFKKMGKFKEFFLFWVVCTTQISLFLLLIYFMPEFGQRVELPAYYNIVLGVIFYFVGFVIYKRR